IPMRTFATEGDNPLVGDALRPPPQRPAVASAGDFKPTLFQPSAFLAGRVAVQLIFVESDGSKEPSTTNWTEAQITLARSQVATALEWWRKQLPNARIDFTLTSRIVPSSYEPIEHGLSSEGLWIGDAYRNMGFTAANYFEQAYSSDDSLRRAQQADWATTIFIANSAGKANGRFADGYFAYAYIGGPFMVITSDAGPYGAAQLTPVVAHEFGHIFGALDQYAAAATPCSQQSGYLAVPTTNSQANNCGSHFTSIMLEPVVAYAQGAIDASALGQVGYRDSDGDHAPDPLDTKPALDVTINQPSAGRPSIAATAVDQPFPSPAGQPVTINDITQIEYRTDGGPWISLPPADGAYDSSTESANSSLPLYDGQHTIEFRAINSTGAASPVTSSSVVVAGVGSAPQYSASVPELANTDTITVALSAPTDSTVQISEDPFFSNARWAPANSSTGWEFDQTDGQRTLYIRFRDAAGLESPSLARSLLLDRVAPTGRVILRDNPTPQLEIQAQDALSGVVEMQIISGSAAGEWRAYQSSLPLAPAPASAENVHIRLRDAAGNVSQPLSASSSLYLPIVIR
ncbi:MAG TPA: hypothetical protein VFU22_31490, partial [Roseiflexaceae bacterium]|nr:hypothetical protein [Roseiflexaceae bacterium]